MKKFNYSLLAIASFMQAVQKTKIDLGNGDNIKHNPRNNRKTKGKKK